MNDSNQNIQMTYLHLLFKISNKKLLLTTEEASLNVEHFYH